MSEKIERRIVIGMAISTEFLKQIQNIFDIKLIESSTGKHLTMWIWEYFSKFNRAPSKDLEGIYFEKLKTEKISEEDAEDIENLIFGLSKESIENPVNIEYLLDQTRKYFRERRLSLFSENIQALIANGELDEAENAASSYKSISQESGEWLELSNPEVLNNIEKAFSTTNQVLIKYGRALGKFWNEQLIRGGFVALMAPEKRGKTFWLLDMAIRGVCHNKVAFFQAGDMNEDQQLKRICIYLAQKSDKAKYSGEMLEPIRDCIKNQLNDCKREERECDFGPFAGKFEKDFRKKINIDDLENAFKECIDYIPCTNCEEYNANKWGAIWLKKVDTGDPLTADEAKEIINNYFIEHKRQFKLSTHINGTLTIKQIRSILDIWEKQEDFVPDIIIIDYADLLEDDSIKEFRHKQNKIWKDLRGLSQEKHCLVITATQTDADSYDRDLLKMDNFSEDKRKYAHCTAMYGLNQDHTGREKELGIMRINEIVVREGDFSNNHQVYVLQNLKRGRPFLTSYW